jgi:hypothetical protein
MIATAVPTRRREVLAIDMATVWCLHIPFVNPRAQLIDWPALAARELNAVLSVVSTGAGRRGN